MKFVGESVRFYLQTEAGFHFLVDMSMEDNSYIPVVSKEKKYNDKIVFKFGHKFIKQHDTLEKFIADQEEKENAMVFPDKDISTIVCLSLDEDNGGKYFLVYDVFLNRFVRKVYKKDVIDDALSSGMSDFSGSAPEYDNESKFHSDAFDVDPTSNVLIYARGRQLRL